MSEGSMSVSRVPIAAQDIKDVSIRLETTFHSIAAMHDLCDDLISKGAAPDVSSGLVMIRDLLRSTARDMENCAEVLDGNRGSLGFFESHFGTI